MEDKNNTSNLQVKEVLDLLPPLQLSREINPNLPNIPGVISMIMRVKSGKTNFLANLLLNSEFYGGDPHIFDMIYIISPTARLDKSSQH